MSFKRMGLEKIKEVASFFDVPVAVTDSKEEIALKLDEAGATFAKWKKFHEEDDEKEVSAGPEAIAFQSTLLLKMNRQNPTLEVFGYKFTKSHPYAVVPTEDAQKIMDAYDGFSIATPSEVKSFYDK